jgi:hypothetical protein
VVSGGSVTFAGLAEKVRYYAYAAGVGRFLLVSSTLKEGDRARIETLESEVGSAPASRLDSVEVGLGRVTTALTDGSDATTALRSDHAAALLLGTHVLLTPGTYRVSGRIHSAGATTDPVRFVAAVPGTVTIERTANTPIIEVTGSRSATVALTANVAAGDSSLTVASLPTSLAAGDYVAVRSSTLLTPTGLAKLAEVMQVQSITGTGPYTINFYGTFEEAYTTAATAVVERLAFAGAGSLLRGIKFRQTAVNRDTSGNPLVRFDVARAGLIAACEFNDADAPGDRAPSLLRLRHRVAEVLESHRRSGERPDRLRRQPARQLPRHPHHEAARPVGPSRGHDQRRRLRCAPSRPRHERAGLRVLRRVVEHPQGRQVHHVRLLREPQRQGHRVLHPLAVHGPDRAARDPARW